MISKLPIEWKDFLGKSIDTSHVAELYSFLEAEYTRVPLCIFPPKEMVFNALKLVKPSDVKVVIIGQDPYPTRGHANGLAFSLHPEVHPLAKSLQNIYRELVDDIGCSVPANGDLTPWAKQGVLLLNAILTVEEGAPQSHKNRGWEKFTDTIISKLSDDLEGVVFILWGSYAVKKGAKIDVTKHCVLTSGHPSPLSANQGKWFGNKHFSKTNAYLQSKGKVPIKWELDGRYDLFNTFVDSSESK